MSSHPHPTRDLFQDEVTTRYTFPPAEVQNPMPEAADPTPPSQRMPREHAPIEQGVSQVFAVRATSQPPSVPEPREFVPLHIMRQLVAEYAEFLGPAAKPVVIAEIVSLHYGPDRFPLSHFPHLAERLVRRLDTSRAAADFVQRLRVLHPTLAKVNG